MEVNGRPSKQTQRGAHRWCTAGGQVRQDVSALSTHNDYTIILD